MANAMAPVASTAGRPCRDPAPPSSGINVYRQASNMDSLDRALKRIDVRETFPGSKDVFRSINSDYFELPPDSIVVCMKTDIVEDVLFSIRFGWMTNNEACSKRMSKIWEERDGKRVFLMFSVKASKHFCALAEMTSPVNFDAEIEGWSKPNCKGVLSTMFHYVKSVPFSVINHLYHEANGQPVANMWNSMVYNDGNGLEVIKHYVEHPIYSSILVLEPGCEFFPTSRLLISSSGTSSYSASSYTSQNDKSNDLRSVTNIRGDRGNKTRDLSGSWRSKAPVSITAGNEKGAAREDKVNGDTTPLANARTGKVTGGFSGTAPPFSLQGQTNSRRPATFTTPDDQTIAAFHAGAAPNAQGSMLPPLLPQRMNDTTTRGDFSTGRGGFQRGAGRGIRQTAPPHVDTVWRGGMRGGPASDGFRGMQSPSSIRHTQTQGYHGITPPGTGNVFQNGSFGNFKHRQSPQSHPYPMTTQKSLDQTCFASPNHSSQVPGSDPFLTGAGGQAAQAYGRPALFGQQNTQMPYLQQGKRLPSTAQPIMQGARFGGYTSNDFAEARRETPMKHYHSTPDFGQSPNSRLDAAAANFVPGSAKNATFSPECHQNTQQMTPTHRTPAPIQALNPSAGFEPMSPFLSNEALSRMSPTRQAEYYAAVEEMASVLRQSAEVRSKFAMITHDVARGDLASSTVDSDPSLSPHALAVLRDSTNAGTPSAVTSSSVEMANIKQFVGRDGRPLRSVSGRRDRHPQDIGHRRGGAESFTSSFDARLTRDTLNLVEDSPSRNQAARDERYGQYYDYEQRGRLSRSRSVRFTSPPRMGQPYQASPVNSSSPPRSARSSDSNGLADTILSYTGSDEQNTKQVTYQRRDHSPDAESQSSFGGVPLNGNKYR